MRLQNSLLVVPPLLLILAAGAGKAETVETYKGACEPSGALGLSDGKFLVANDEDNVLRVYSQGSPEPVPAADGDISGALGLDSGDEDEKIDLEAAARVGGRSFFVGSHSRDKKRKRRPSRELFISVSVEDTAQKPKIAVSKPATLMEALAEVDAIKASIALDDLKHEALAAEAEGLSIEGLAEGLDGKSALIGLRSPLSSDGKAMVVPLLNPAGVVDDKDAPELGTPLFVDLGGRGIRSLERSPGTGGYLIVAGPRQTEGEFALYSWSGLAGDAAQPMDKANEFLSSQEKFHPEAMLVDASGSRVRLFSNDGDLPDPSGTTCRELPDPDSQHFRNVEIDVP